MLALALVLMHASGAGNGSKQREDIFFCHSTGRGELSDGDTTFAGQPSADLMRETTENSSCAAQAYIREPHVV